MKKKHSKTGEESRYQGTVLGKSAEEHPIVIEGGAESINSWGKQVRSRAEEAIVADSSSSAMSSVPSGLSEDEAMGGF
jgi:transcription initiation factor TFIID subunit 3